MRRMIAGGTLLLLMLTAGGMAAHAENLPLALEGKTGGERREILRLACLNEAEWSTRQRNRALWFREHNTAAHQPPTDETIRLKNLCRAMDELRSRKAGHFDQRVDLAQQCAKEIHVGIRNNTGADNIRHFENMRRICEELIEAKVPE